MFNTAPRRWLMSVIGIAALVSLAACSQAADPAVVEESLKQVTEAPVSPETDDEYDAHLHPEPIVEPLDECAPTLVITVRGTGEPTKGQLLGSLARKIHGHNPDDTEVIDLEYPADTEVSDGGTLGARTLIDTLNVQALHCPKQQFVLLGYSQGALVIGDALSDPATRLVGTAVGEVDEAAAERIRAIVFYGDPRFVGSAEFNRGDYDPSFNGLLPRPVDALAKFSDRIADYCVAQDFICQSGIVIRDGGEIDEEGHVEYFHNDMRKQGAKFVLDRLGELD